MRKNIAQKIVSQKGKRLFLENDWFGAGIPAYVLLGNNFYISSSKGFEKIDSENNPCLTIGKEVGLYDQFGFEIGDQGVVSVGDYSIINSARIRCVDHVSIGKFCMLSWKTFITDSWVYSHEGAKELLSRADFFEAKTKPLETTKPVVIEDNVWIGFGCTILPGVTIGKGSVISSNTVVRENVPPNTVVGGNPLRILKKL